MLNHLIEIVFKNVPVRKIGRLLKNLTKDGLRIVSYNFTCDSVNISWGVEKEVEALFLGNKNFGLFLNLNELIYNEISFCECGIAIYKYENSIDVEVNFELSDLKNIKEEELVENLMKFAKSISVSCQIEDYFCGLEPAKDINTRLFTKEQMGPLFLRRQGAGGIGGKSEG